MKSRPSGILLVCHSYPPVLGGSEIEAQRVSVGLMRRGNRVRVLCAGGPPMPDVQDWVDPAGVPVSILTRKSEGRRRDGVFALNVAWNIFRRRREFDMVYFLMQGLHVAFGLPVARFLGIPIVMKISGDGIISTMRRSRAGRFELNCLRKWKIPLMLLNEGMANEAVAAGLPREQITWMPNPVEVGEFHPARGNESAEWRAAHDIPPGALVVVYTGRLSPEKGLKQLIGGFAQAEESNSFLLLIGDGPMRAELQEYAAQRLPEAQIRFTGRVPLADIPCWLRASNVFALTSPNEGFSCSLLEAMSCALPSVVSDIPANLQLVEPGVHGLATRWDDEAAIAQALLRIFHDAALRERLGNAARARVVENYATDSVIDRYEQVFARGME